MIGGILSAFVIKRESKKELQGLNYGREQELEDFEYVRTALFVLY